MHKVVKQIDCFGEKPSFFINDNSQHKTLLGGTFVLISIIFCLICGAYFGQELWLKTNPNVNLVKETVDYPLPLPIDKDKFDFFIQIGTAGVIDNSVYYLTATLQNSSLNYPIDLEICTNSSFTKENLELLYPFNFRTSWCIKKNQSVLNSSNFNIQGLYGQENFLMISFKLFTCVNTTQNKNSCATPAKISEILGNNYLSIYMIDNFIQTNNFLQPTVKTVKDIFFLISDKFYTTGTTYIHPIKILSDDQLVFQSGFNEVKSFSLEPVFTYINPNLKSNKIATWGIQLTNFNEIYYRTYMKIQNLLALLGGIINFLQIIILVICWNYSRASYFEELINSYYSFNIEKKKMKTMKIKKSSTILKGRDINHERKDTEMYSKPTITEMGIIKSGNKLSLNHAKTISIDYDFKLNLKDHHHKVNFSFSDKFCCSRYLSCHFQSQTKKKHLFFEFGIQTLKEKLCITNLLRTLVDVERLKFILFDQSQLFAFDHIKKPYIDFEINKFKSQLDQYIFRDKKTPVSQEELEMTLKRVVNDKSQIGQKIIEIYSMS